MILRLLLLAVICPRLNGLINNSLCTLSKMCDEKGSCGDFSSFRELNTSQCVYGHFSTEYLRLQPSIPVVLDKTLKLNDLISVVIGSNYSAHLILYNILGLDLNFIPSFTRTDIRLVQLINTRFEFFMNGEHLDMSCKNREWLNMYSYPWNILGISQNDLTIKNSRFPSNLCPSVFHGLDLNNFQVYGNQILFDNKDYAFLDKIRVLVRDSFTIMYSYKVVLSNQTLHPAVFANMTSFYIDIASVHSIQVETFKSFDQLKLVSLKLINLRYFFHHNQIYWMINLHGLSIIESAIDFGINYFYSSFYQNFKACDLYIYNHVNDQGLYSVEFFPYLEYQYPDEDYCLFSPFPQNNHLVPYLYGPYTAAQCSCTLFWIMDQVGFYVHYEIMNKDELLNDPNYPIFKACYNQSRSDCNQTSLQQLCAIKNDIRYKDEYFEIYDLKHLIQDAQDVFLGILGPVVSAVSILTNSLVIITIKKAPKSKTPLKESICDGAMYKYMLMNAAINLLYSILYFFVYLIKCDLKNATNLGYIQDTCFQEQIYVDITGSVLKIMSNMSFLQLSLNRFVLVGLNHYEFIVSLSHARPKLFLFISAVISVLLNIIIYFKQDFFGSQSIASGYVISEDYYYHNYYWSTSHKADYLEIVQDKLQNLPVIFSFMLIHDFFSYVFFCLASTLIDILTVKNLRGVLAEKKKKVNSAERDKEARKSEIKSISMIVLSSLSNFILRFPELTSIIFFYTLLFNKQSHYIFKTLCYAYRECLPIVEMTNVFYLMALSINFVFYVSFDNNFKESFGSLTTKFVQVLVPIKKK